MSTTPDTPRILHLLNAGGYFRLLFSASPTKLDVVLLLAAILFAVANGLTFPLLGILFGKLIDDLNSSSCDTEDGGSSAAVRTKVLLLVAVAGGQFIVTYVYMSCWMFFGERLARRLRQRYLAALLRQEAAYLDTLPSGAISSRLNTDIRAIQEATSEKVGIVLTSLSYFVAAYGISATLDATLTLLMFSMVPAYLAIGATCSALVTRYDSEINALTATTTSIAAQGLSNVKLVHAFGAQSRLEKIFAASSRQMQAPAARKFIVEALQLGLLYFVSHAANALAIWQGSKGIAESRMDSAQELTVGDVYTVIFMLVDASFVITRVAPYFPIFAAGLASSKQLSAAAERTSSIDGTISVDNQSIRSIRSFQTAIEFRDVTFRYPSRPQQNVLQGLSLHLPAGRFIGVVGPSGSGKSTIASLIPRLYDVDEGQILFDGCDVRDIKVKDLRSLISVVEQSPSLLECSILENVALGLVASPRLSHLHGALLDGGVARATLAIRNGATVEEATRSDVAVAEVLDRVQACLKLAGAFTFVQHLQHGMATHVGHEGRQLSGGQAQRVGIARALIKDAPILVLDEATASLDSTMERSIQAMIESQCKGKTVICIAHRLSTIKNADHIIVMREGDAVEQGSFGELVEADGSFASMVQTQGVDDTSEASTPADNISHAGSSLCLSEVEAKLAVSPIIHNTDQMPFIEVSETTPLLGASVTATSARPTQNTVSDSFFKTLRRVVSLARSERRYLLLGCFAAALSGISSPASALAFGNMIGSMSPCNDVGSILTSGAVFGMLFMTLACYDVLVTTLRGSCFGRVAERVSLTARILTFRSLFYQSAGWHESESRNPNALLSQLTSDASSLSAMSGNLVGVSLSIVVNLGLGILLSLLVAWRIAVVLIAAIPFLLASGYLRLQVFAYFNEKHREAFSNSVSIAKDAIDHFSTVSLFSLEQYSVRAYLRSLKDPYRETQKNILAGGFWLAVSYSICTLIYAFAYWWGAYVVEQKEYTQTQFFVVLPALLISAQQCGQLFTLAPDISRAGTAAREIFKQLDIGPEDPSVASIELENSHGDEDVERGSLSPYLPRGEDSPLKPRAGTAIMFDEVKFAYPTRLKLPVLHGLSLTIQSNQFCAITGPSGAGKSTLFSLVAAFYQPSAGRITLNGQPLATQPHTFRDNIAYVPQEAVLFHASVRWNIALGFPPGVEGSQADIEAACKLANIHDVIAKLPQGYDTVVGGSGRGALSGGQKQRMALARALVRKPALLLLDEATSALDGESERRWSESLEMLMGRRGWGMTVVAIAHRLSTVRKADRIFWVEGGKCAASGPHAELYARCEGYRIAVDEQRLGSQ